MKSTTRRVRSFAARLDFRTCNAVKEGNISIVVELQSTVYAEWDAPPKYSNCHRRIQRII